METISYYAIPLLRSREPVKSKPEVIIEKVCAQYDVTLNELKMRCRKKELVFARHLCMYLLRKGTKLSLKQIASIFGHSDHTSVIHATSSILDYIQTDSLGKRDEILKLHAELIH